MDTSLVTGHEEVQDQVHLRFTSEGWYLKQAWVWWLPPKVTKEPMYLTHPHDQSYVSCSVTLDSLSIILGWIR